MPAPETIRRLVARFEDKQPAAPVPQDKEHLQQEIESTDRATDRLVYELYGLTEEEIKIVEGD